MKKYAIALIIVLLLAGVATAGPQHTRGAASRATALAANGANCPSGQAPLGVDEYGAVEGCFAVAVSESDPIVKAVNGLVKSNGSAISAAGAGTDYVVPGGNVATATALAADPANCAAGQIAIGITAAGVAECTATPSGLTSVGATTFTGALTGNASTASALAANGANCSAGQAPLGVDASGAAEGCFGVVTAEADPVVKAVVGIVKSNGSALSAASAGTDYVVPAGNVATATALAADPANCAAGQIAIGITAAGVAECTATPSGLTSVGATTFTGALTGNASTASALAANGANCSAGQAPLGVDASGAAEGCFGVIESITGNYSTVDFTVKSLTAAKTDGVAGASLNYEANSMDTSVVGWMGPASIAESWAYQFSSTQPTAGQIMVFGAPSGSGGPGGMKSSAQSWTDLPVKATSSEINTGTDDVKFATPDGLAASYVGTKDVGWTIFDSDTVTATGDGKKGYVVPVSLTGMNLVDFTCSIYNLNSASGGTTTVVLRRSRAGTDVNMTSTGVTIDYNAYTASDETIDTSNDDVATGDLLFIDVDAVTTGAAQKGLSCTALFRLP